MKHIAINHLIVSRAARMTLTYETSLKLAYVTSLATVVHSNNDVGAACASGSREPADRS